MIWWLLIGCFLACVLLELFSHRLRKYYEQQRAAKSAQIKALNIVQRLQNAANAGPSVDNFDAIMQFIRDARAIDLNEQDNTELAINVTPLYGPKSSQR